MCRTTCFNYTLFKYHAVFVPAFARAESLMVLPFAGLCRCPRQQIGQSICEQWQQNEGEQEP